MTTHSQHFLALLCLMKQDLLGRFFFQGSCPHHFNTMQSLTSDEITTSKKTPTSANLIIPLDYGRLMLGGPSPQHLVLLDTS